MHLSRSGKKLAEIGEHLTNMNKSNNVNLKLSQILTNHINILKKFDRAYKTNKCI